MNTPLPVRLWVTLAILIANGGTLLANESPSLDACLKKASVVNDAVIEFASCVT
ncbi:hypothetical protein [Cellvibrio polysaccharolyticus]|uniref:hypothetical protein n=1 Tax=Cellvibrio polysaccharolyticus TaxID=2082724 RepID=UPI00187E7A92|nr:hypothetical protein [Cellvibrio polysaccharolyticus]